MSDQYNTNRIHEVVHVMCCVLLVELMVALFLKNPFEFRNLKKHSKALEKKMQCINRKVTSGSISLTLSFWPAGAAHSSFPPLPLPGPTPRLQPTTAASPSPSRHSLPSGQTLRFRPMSPAATPLPFLLLTDKQDRAPSSFPSNTESAPTLVVPAPPWPRPSVEED